MKEEEWLNSIRPATMVRHLRETKVGQSERRWRLFGCACCRRVWRLFTEEASRRAVEVSERYADGQAESVELFRAHEDASAARGRVGRQEREFSLRLMAAMAAALVSQEGADVSWFDWVRSNNALNSGNDPNSFQSAALRDVFGNPFHSVTLDPTWLAWNDGTVRKMAWEIAERQAFDQLPLLGDALEDAGCADREMLAHCHGGGKHVRGCWVVDLLLGRS